MVGQSLTSPGQPGLSLSRACMTSQCITSWGLSSNGITSLCPSSWHTLSTRRDPPEGQVSPLVVYKEGVSRTVVRELLPRATAHGHQTFPDYGRHTRSRSKGGRHALRSTCRGVRGKKPPNDRPPTWIYGEIIRFSAHAPMLPIQKKNPTVVRELLPRTLMKRAQTFPAVARCTSHQYKVVDVLKKLMPRSARLKPRMNRPLAILDLGRKYAVS